MTDSAERVWQLAHKRSLPLDGPPLIMGIINVTPDSFSDGGLYTGTESAVAHGLRLVAGGADILDIGGESTRPGSRPVPPDEQIARVKGVVEQLARQTPAAISVDTQSAEVARECLDAGAHIINDISAMTADEKMASTVARRNAGLVLMHMQGTPADMQDDPTYDDVVAEVGDWLGGRVSAALAEGIPAEAILVDPGIGFGKTTAHNLQLISNLEELRRRAGGQPVLVGPSRKRFIGELLDLPVNERLAGTVGACVVAALGGAKVLRVHDPGPIRQAVTIAWQSLRHRRGD